MAQITRTTKVLGLVERRVGAQPAKQFAEDLTPASEYAKMREANYHPTLLRAKGTGRPTKKERRSLDKFF
jgi:ribosome-associated heat shock protein Hsp15